MPRTITLLVLLLLFLQGAWGQSIQLDSAGLEAYRNKADYAYQKTVKMEQDYNLIEDLFYSIRKLLFYSEASPILSKIFYGILIALVVFALYKAYQMEAIGVSFKKSKGQEEPELTIKNIHSIDFAQETTAAEQQEEWGRALRLRFLWALKLLAEGQLIQWKPAKTNADYLLEMKDKTCFPAYQALDMEYERSAYGNFPVDQQRYLGAKALFQQIHEKIQSPV